jgi:hypothetical protein
MPTQNARKHKIPATGEQTVNRTTIFEGFANSIRDVVPVASVNERNQLVQALNAKSEGPAATRPLVVLRLDAPGLHRVESTTDGTNWIPTSGLLNFVSKTAANSFATSNGGLLTAGDECLVAGVRHRWSGSVWYVPFAGARAAAGTNGNGIVTVQHGMGKTPLGVTATVAIDSPVIVEALKLEVGNLTDTTFDVRFRRSDQGQAVFAGNPVVFYWTAVA